MRYAIIAALAAAFFMSGCSKKVIIYNPGYYKAPGVHWHTPKKPKRYKKQSRMQTTVP